MSGNAPLASHLIDLSPSTLSLLKRVTVAIALIAVLFSLVGSRYAILDFKPGGSAFNVEIRPIITGVFVLAILLGLRWQIAGGVLAALAAGALVAFATHQLVATHATLVVALLAIPAILWVIIDMAELERTMALIGAGIALAAAVGGYFIGDEIYDYFWGPQHPESTIAALPESELAWVWTGSMTTTQAEVRARAAIDYDNARLKLSASANYADADFIGASDEQGRVMGFNLDGLEPDTEYFYAVELDGVVDEVRTGRFRTFPDGAASYRVAIGSCARVGSNGKIFDTIRETDPLLYLITGDLHYGDNGRDDVTRFQQVMDLTLALPAQSALYRSAPIAYMWDDHDYGGNDSDGLSPSRRAAMAAYREYVPSYDLSAEDSAVYQAFTIGRVRYILTDARSARNTVDGEVPTMYGSEQKEWFKNEVLASSKTHELVIWINPVPWVAAAEPGADHWGGFAEERRELANHIVDNNIDKLFMISGDAHMVAIDDGTNTNFSDQPGPGFPLLHASALDRPGSVKGGPYSEGAIGNGGQFATLDISDDGDSISVTMQALDWEGKLLMEHSFSTGS